MLEQSLILHPAIYDTDGLNRALSIIVKYFCMAQN